VPSGSIEDQDRVSAIIDCLADFQQMLAGVGIATLTFSCGDGTRRCTPTSSVDPAVLKVKYHGEPISG
jgi:hypothetical protein